MYKTHSTAILLVLLLCYIALYLLLVPLYCVYCVASLHLFRVSTNNVRVRYVLCLFRRMPHSLPSSLSYLVSVLLSLYVAGAEAFFFSFSKRAQNYTNNALRSAHHITTKHSLCVNCTHQTEHYSICISSLLQFGSVFCIFQRRRTFCSSLYIHSAFYIFIHNQAKPDRLLSKSFSRRTLKVIVLLCVLFPCKIKYNRRYLVTK